MGIFRPHFSMGMCKRYVVSPTPFFLIASLFFISIYLFLAATDLRCGARASHWGDFSCRRASALEPWLKGCGAQAWLPGGRVRSSLTRDGTIILCILRQVLNHWTPQGNPIVSLEWDFFIHACTQRALNPYRVQPVKNQDIFLEEKECEWRRGAQRGRRGAGSFQGWAAVSCCG